MAPANKRSLANREAPMADTAAPKEFKFVNYSANATTPPPKRIKTTKAKVSEDQPTSSAPTGSTTPAFNTPASLNTSNVDMTEVRARAARHKGQMNFETELTQALYAYGDDICPLPETVRVLDEIVTDFIIETCFSAAKSAEICGRSKLKVDDFKWAIRGDPLLLGRVNELLAMDKHISTARKAFKTDEGREGLERGGRKKKGEGKDGEEKAEDKIEDKGVKVEDKMEEDLGDLDDEDME